MPFTGEGFHVAGRIPQHQKALARHHRGPAAEGGGDLPARLLQPRRDRQAGAGEHGPGRMGCPGALQGLAIEGRRQVELAVLPPHQAHVALAADGHVDAAGRIGGRRVRQHAARPDPGVALDDRGTGLAGGDAALGQPGGHQHHLRPHRLELAATAFLEGHHPARGVCRAQLGRGAGPEAGARADRCFHQRLVEPLPGEGAAVGQGQRRPLAPVAQLQPPQRHPALGVDQLALPHRRQHRLGLGIEAAATHFPAGVLALLHQQHPQPPLGQIQGRQATGWAGPHHHHIPAVAGLACRLLGLGVVQLSHAPNAKGNARASSAAVRLQPARPARPLPAPRPVERPPAPTGGHRCAPPRSD
jgi:hypothetical protein